MLESSLILLCPFLYGDHADAFLTHAELGIVLMMPSLENRGVYFWNKEPGLVTWRQLGQRRKVA